MGRRKGRRRQAGHPLRRPRLCSPHRETPLKEPRLCGRHRETPQGNPGQRRRRSQHLRLIGRRSAGSRGPESERSGPLPLVVQRQRTGAASPLA